MKKAIFIGSALGRNAIPVGAFLFGGYSAETTLVIYFLETIIAILLAAFVTDWLLLPFAFLKTVTDIGAVVKMIL